MAPTTLILSEQDRTRLLIAIERAASSWRTAAPYVNVLRERVLTAEILPRWQLPQDRVALWDRVQVLHARPLARETVQLVLPWAYTPARGTLSVISPLGIELLGAKAGETVQWFTDDGPRQALVEKVIRESPPPESVFDHYRLEDPASPRRPYVTEADLVWA
jgi:regulator of nucleoside diphosphate kinase